MGASELTYVDVEGLAIDYDGSKTNFHSSKNYSLQEYANDISVDPGGYLQRQRYTPPQNLV